MGNARAEAAFLPPDDANAKVWRYMDFTRFVSMLENRGFFFSRLDRLGDPFEGSLSRADEDLREHYSDSVRAAAASFTVNSRKRVMVNCWHMGAHESEAMWKLYADGGRGLAIQSTYDKLCRAVSGAITGVGLVRYIDYAAERMDERHPFYSAFLHKRKSLEHEKEIRALIYNRDGEISDRGEFVKVDLLSVIDIVHVAPESEAWYEQLVRSVVARYGLDIPVHRSSLEDGPIF